MSQPSVEKSMRATTDRGRVDVLLSTYNGARYLDLQLRTILEQTWRNLHLVVRDDGSTDTTHQILARAAASDRRVSVERGENVGPVASFLGMLSQVSDGADYAAFADQDDVWNADKIERGVEAIEAAATGRPVLYCSRAVVTDGALAPIGGSPDWPKAPSFANALVENIAAGCTIVMNRPAIALLKGPPPSRAVLAHDWWCYIVVSAFGTVIFDRKPSMLYRQHRDNTIGIKVSPLARLIKKIERQFKHNTLALIVAQAEAFSERYGARLSQNDAATLSALLNIKSFIARLGLTARSTVYRQSITDDLLLKARLLVGTLHR